MKPRILHIAPMNTSGVPGQFVLAERKLGFHSRLITLFRDKRSYFEDICLDLPFIDFTITRMVKKLVSSPDKLVVDSTLRIPDKIPPQWQPHSVLEQMLVALRDRLWKPKIERAIRQYGLDQYDVYQLDGGLDFYRFPRFIPQMKKRGKKIICCYTGSDLRTRGVIPQIDALADVTVSVEFDHLKLHPRIHHVFFPFDASAFEPKQQTKSDKLFIGHAPTNWQAKGSHIIVPVLERLAKEYPVEVVLIENMPYAEALKAKQNLDIFVDQIGDLGYGINSLEALAMAIPTCSCLAPGFEEAYPDHPFVVIDENNIYDKLVQLIVNSDLRFELGRKGRAWVLAHHSAVESVRRIHKLAGIPDEAE